MKEKIEFKTETKRLLDMMINSIYTHKEIFLRELISNASDAIDKRHYLSLTNTELAGDEYQILVEADKDNKTLTITDNGVGMTKEECLLALGSPNLIDRLPSNAGILEFWKYNNGNQLLFDDGLLKEFRR